jgi:hypothetical protein
VNLAAGANQLRVTAASDDGSWEAIPVELELNCTHRAERKGRLFVVAVGIGDYAEPDLKTTQPATDAEALAALLQRRSAALYDRVDVVPVLGKDATRARIQETMRDVAGLSQPQDTVMLLVCGRGTMLGDHLYFAPPDLRFSAASGFDQLTAGRDNDFRQQGLDADELAGLLGTARGLNRVLVLDAADVATARTGDKTKVSGFALRAAVERWSRAQGVYAIAACSNPISAAKGASTPGLLAGLLLDAAGNGNGGSLTASTGRDANNAIGVMDWFNAATDRAGAVIQRLGLDPQVLQASSRPKGFPLLVAAR